MSKVKHISVPFVHKETLNLEYVNKTRGVTLIIGNLLKQQDIVVKISYSKEDMAHCKNLTERTDIDFYHTIKNLIEFWYLVKKQSRRQL